MTDCVYVQQYLQHIVFYSISYNEKQRQIWFFEGENDLEKEKTISIDLFSETSHLKPYFTPSLAIPCMHMACFLNIGIEKKN